VLRRLPSVRLDACKRLAVRVGPSSTIRVLNNTYSVHSRLKDEKVQVRVYAEHLDVFYAQRRVERLPRLRGKDRHLIQYPHIIDWLVRKPGALANYRYRADLYPTSRFRQACDLLEQQHAPRRAHRIYLEILQLAAEEGEAVVDQALGSLLASGIPLSKEIVQANSRQNRAPARDDIKVRPVRLAAYDELLDTSEPSRPMPSAPSAGFPLEAAG